MPSDTDSKKIKRHTIWRDKRDGTSVQVTDPGKFAVEYDFLDGPYHETGATGVASRDSFLKNFEELF